MGRFASIGAKIKEKAKQAKDAVVSGIKKLASKAKEKVTNMSAAITGKKTFEQAEQLYEEIESRYNERRSRFDADVQKYTDQIEAHVNAINASKRAIKTELFPSMAHKMEKIKDISVSRGFAVEEFVAAVLNFDGIRSKEALYTIDFNKHKFKTTVQAIFTLGFYTRKKAKETLLAVQEEEAKINTEIAKMDAETTKLMLIEQSLGNVEYYFADLTELYGTLLARLDNSVNYLYVNCMAFAHKLIHTEMSVKRLPKMQRKEVEAIVTASQILKAMVDMKVTSVDNQEEIKKYGENLKEQHEEMNKVYQAA